MTAEFQKLVDTADPYLATKLVEWWNRNVSEVVVSEVYDRNHLERFRPQAEMWLLERASREMGHRLFFELPYEEQFDPHSPIVKRIWKVKVIR